VDRWYFTDLPTPRAQSAAKLMAAWESRETGKNVLASAWPDPAGALQAAIAAAGPADRIVIFGSFYTVGGVLKDGIPRLHAKHLSA
jgi:dihydrofolate synthase/folylpolyglutamate synthase